MSKQMKSTSSSLHPFARHAAPVAMLMIAIFTILSATAARAAEATAPIVSEGLVFEEVDGVLAIEAEHFYKQTLTDVRAWYIMSTATVPEPGLDGDPAHVGGAAGGAYVEALPDTRRTHDDRLIHGQNFSNQPGKLAVLHYQVHINTPGRYYVWARAYSTGTEDNGLHFGLDGDWPASGQRWQTVAKHRWHWESKQRTEQVHTGVPYMLYLDIDQAGPHEITVAMREDGFELDRFVLTTRREEGRPRGLGPEVRVKRGQLPVPFSFLAASPRKAFPPHWGRPPEIETGDYVPLPDGYGHGSSTLAHWILAKLADDRAPTAEPRQPSGDGKATVSGDLMQWHKVTLTVDGPFAHERDQSPNPFTDVRMQVRFVHESGAPSYVVPGYFAADGDAANSGAQSGVKWRAHLSPDKPGAWKYEVSLVSGAGVVHDESASARPVVGDGAAGGFTIAPTDKTGRDFRAHGRLQYVGGHYLRFAGDGGYFLKAGPDAPETLLAYTDFDDTTAPKSNAPLKTWRPHLSDWREGDPTWRDGKGKGLIGALNYLASKGCNTFSFLPYNAGGDGDNVWPFVSRDDKLHYDCSKLDQWQIVFDHATALGLHLHFKLQETEMDDDRVGHQARDGAVKESLDGGKLGPERKLYCRELIARFGHELALLWNLGEENTQSPAEQRDMIRYLHEVDPYGHNIVVHTYPDQQDKVYPELLGDKSLLTGASLQNSWRAAHQRTLKWLRESAQAGRPWVVCNDEQNPASDGVPADPGYEGGDGFAEQNGQKYNLHDIRKYCLWGTLTAGGGGVEYYFGYQLPQNDLICEDFRSRDRAWDYCRIAIEFFHEHQIPFWEMTGADALIGNAAHTNSRYCLAKQGACYLVYLPTGGTSGLDLGGAEGDFRVEWFNPREGGALRDGSVTQVSAGGVVQLGDPPQDAEEDWLVVVRPVGK